jgi:hypothetical protein
VTGGWRHGPNNGGVPVAVLALVALPVGMLAWRQWRKAG